MVAVEITVSLIGGGVSIITPIIGYIIHGCKKNNENSSSVPPQPPKYCQILETPVLRIMGRPFVDESKCHEEKSQCPDCNKYFCPYHKSKNTDNTVYGGHICECP